MKNKAAQKLGKLGGKKTASLYGHEHFSNAGKKGGWPKGKKRKPSAERVDAEIQR